MAWKSKECIGKPLRCELTLVSALYPEDCIWLELAPMSSSESSSVSSASTEPTSGRLPFITTIPRKLRKTKQWDERGQTRKRTVHQPMREITYSIGDGSRPCKEASEGTYSFSPRIRTSWSATTSWYGMLQWFSNNRIMGNVSGWKFRNSFIVLMISLKRIFVVIVCLRA